MLDSVLILCILLLILYLGPVLGLMIHCDNNPHLSEVKRFAYVVPLLTFVLSISYIDDACKGDKSAVEFLREKNKQLIVLAGIFALPDVQSELIQIETSLKQFLRFQKNIFEVNIRNFCRCIKKPFEGMQNYIEGHAFML